MPALNHQVTGTSNERFRLAFRLGAIRDADTLVVLDEGKVVEQGTHPKLMAGGVYAKLFSMQAAGYESDESPSEPDKPAKEAVS